MCVCVYEQWLHIQYALTFLILDEQCHGCSQISDFSHTLLSLSANPLSTPRLQPLVYFLAAVFPKTAVKLSSPSKLSAAISHGQGKEWLCEMEFNDGNFFNLISVLKSGVTNVIYFFCNRFLCFLLFFFRVFIVCLFFICRISCE